MTAGLPGSAASSGAHDAESASAVTSPNQKDEIVAVDVSEITGRTFRF